MKNRSLLIICLVFLSWVACGGGGGDDNTVTDCDSAGNCTITDLSGNFSISKVEEKGASALPSYSMKGDEEASISCGSEDNTNKGYLEVGCNFSSGFVQFICSAGSLAYLDTDNTINEIGCTRLNVFCNETQGTSVTCDN